VNKPANKIRARLPISKGFARMLNLFDCHFQVQPKNGSSVTPAQVGVQNWSPRFGAISWIPACAGMTVFIAHP
jgi:hypothetical protein